MERFTVQQEAVESISQGKVYSAAGAFENISQGKVYSVAGSC